MQTDVYTWLMRIRTVATDAVDIFVRVRNWTFCPLNLLPFSTQMHLKFHPNVNWIALSPTNNSDTPPPHPTNNQTSLPPMKLLNLCQIVASGLIRKKSYSPFGFLQSSCCQQIFECCVYLSFEVICYVTFFDLGCLPFTLPDNALKNERLERTGDATFPVW